MKEVIMYQANDGSIHTNKNQAEFIDSLEKSANDILDFLSPDLIAPSNGGGYIQLEKENVETAQAMFLNLCNIVLKSYTPFTNAKGIVGRYVDDSGYKPLQKLSYTINCIDSNYRKWGQVYYALNPQDGSLKQLN